LKTVLKKKLEERGSLRGEFMANLAQKILHILVELLCAIFENRHSLLYRSQEHQDERINHLFLQILSEPKIVRVSQTVHQHSIVPKDDIPGGCSFPFSAHIHAFISSFRETCFEIYERMKHSIQEGLVEFLIVQIYASIQAHGLNLNLNRFPKDIMQKLLRDIVHLEVSTLGLRRFSKHQQTFDALVNHVCSFVERAALDALEKFGNSKYKKQAEVVLIKENKEEVKQEEEKKKKRKKKKRKKRTRM